MVTTVAIVAFVLLVAFIAFATARDALEGRVVRESERIRASIESCNKAAAVQTHVCARCEDLVEKNVQLHARYKDLADRYNKIAEPEEPVNREAVVQDALMTLSVAEMIHGN